MFVRRKYETTGGDSRIDTHQVIELGSNHTTILMETAWFILGVRCIAETQPERRADLLRICQDSILLLLFRADFSDMSKIAQFSHFFQAANHIQDFLDKEGHLFVSDGDASPDGVSA